LLGISRIKVLLVRQYYTYATWLLSNHSRAHVAASTTEIVYT
jgi:hypothetical protein